MSIVLTPPPQANVPLENFDKPLSPVCMAQGGLGLFRAAWLGPYTRRAIRLGMRQKDEYAHGG